MSLTPIKIKREQFREYDCFRFNAEMSELRLSSYPREIETDLGNGQLLRLSSATQDKAVYRQDLGCITVTLFND